MSIHEAYSNWAATYDADQNWTRDLDQFVTRDILSAQRYQSILEIGCGTGKNTALLSMLGKRVYALDFSAGMLAQAKAKSQQDNVLFTLADLTTPWPCADRQVDLVVCNLVLEHIRDLTFIFSEAARVLEDRGRFFISELHPFRQYAGKKAVFQRAGREIEISAFVHHLSDFLHAAASAGFTLTSLEEWWHETDQARPPRLVSFLFEK